MRMAYAYQYLEGRREGHPLRPAVDGAGPRDKNARR